MWKIHLSCSGMSHPKSWQAGGGRVETLRPPASHWKQQAPINVCENVAWWSCDRSGAQSFPDCSGKLLQQPASLLSGLTRLLLGLRSNPAHVSLCFLLSLCQHIPQTHPCHSPPKTSFRWKDWARGSAGEKSVALVWIYVSRPNVLHARTRLPSFRPRLPSSGPSPFLSSPFFFLIIPIYSP